jgi:hypothetical protein
MWWRIRLITLFERVITAVTASDMTSAVAKVLVTASAEHIPRTCRVIGFWFTSGLRKALVVG